MTNLVFGRRQAEALVYREARLLDDLELDEWLTLFTDDGIYWVPIDENAPVDESVSIIYDWPLRREERVRHLLDIPFPAQSPRSRTMHLVSNVESVKQESGEYLVRTNQIIHEIRVGDFSQVGLGVVNVLAGQVHYTVRIVNGNPLIAMKKVLLLNREMPQGNLTFML
ncbi:aromatic-ring-hydroxylating dioxygenase subunit beta [Rhizomonospora bruguierae]|uniref:aromatic-ring-hydroxylating dioxygenase subunit beta n=1 Tax=Rhizomonospora bruguierae TaxID=1581705 RepID=UPI001BCD72DE|nr:aromatic-ring-hydroxylating dioxygenase subunit beta [Micromonospora sp. NBRC 107566]